MELTERPDTLVDGVANGADIAAKLLVTGQQDAIALPTATTDPVFGLTRGVIKNGQHGSLMMRGKGICTAGTGGVTKGQRIMPEANTGCGITWTSAHSIAGVAMTTAAAGADFEIELLGPGATAA